MPIFGGSKRPKLDGLTRNEQKRRDALNPEVLRRSGQQGATEAALSVLYEKAEEEPREPLWPLLLGSQLMTTGRFAPALAAFTEASSRDAGEVRAHYGAAMACYQAAEYKRAHGEAPDAAAELPEQSASSLYQESLRHFQAAMELTPDKSERDELASSAAIVRRAIARKAGRL
jgi:tetratricopeptide (TPR) repeat protein